MDELQKTQKEHAEEIYYAKRECGEVLMGECAEEIEAFKNKLQELREIVREEEMSGVILTTTDHHSFQFAIPSISRWTEDAYLWWLDMLETSKRH